MARDGEGPDFELDGLAVGHFTCSAPDKDGPATYMPFRGPGHAALQGALAAGERPRCAYRVGNRRVTFEVGGCPAYGVLTLCAFEES